MKSPRLNGLLPVIGLLTTFTILRADDSPKEASYGKITFAVTTSSEAGGEKSRFTITPSGLSESNEPFSVTFQGKVVEVMADDIDGDNSPEVAVITEEGADQKRKAHVFTTFGGKSFGMVNFPDITDEALLAGYRGGDEYQFVEGTFIRRFPLFDNSGAKSGKYRQLQFKLKPGEAMKQLKLDRQVEF